MVDAHNTIQTAKKVTVEYGPHYVTMYIDDARVVMQPNTAEDLVCIAKNNNVPVYYLAEME